MKVVLVSGAVALLVSLLGTPMFIRLLVRRNYGQFIRQDGPTAHFTKRGTPTMGGVVIIAATVLGWLATIPVTGRIPTASEFLLIFLMVGMGLVGFLDDFIKISRQRSLGLSPMGKIIGQGVVGIVFSVLVLQFENSRGVTPASTAISFTRDTNFDLAFAGAGIGIALFVVWANFLITAWTNAVNLTDGLDGLATGVSLFVFGAYLFVSIWQYNQNCAWRPIAESACYETRDPLGLAIIAAAIVGACFGFLWWNGSPAQIFMGDTGSLALGGALAGISILTRTEILAAIIGGLFVLIVVSDVIQIGFFKMTGKRVFKMAPLHHHFELSGWGEVTIVIRFWIIAGLFVAAGLGLFYGEWIVS
ncbi:phospho-N-acetylmuramoyl-pentapeptide-transferase [Jonesia denitrificans]|uniref:Phospho-N-acetylmuramoyl-pentapeptide-transferase n=1 Tax=Jonesia denitrificans (strain ATCC 14870 / DSM 20603 / BCRC 15368 / CIP 55.134 / JCM 11481 / NBRC 15587 / NCTC 10816 / Prevot 55134) TaxID=471856 RepID=C7R3J1_JONDD|nr:phospho-N-acetylmuramoyl-pentapeptide-transferase [Jonesia denitrificans]ACV08727.1 phospho-N-acetylmuramoyl-pentapeptide-transferase [Jonesia denitrificans DSM 20603]ASE09945.1 phospho-N-acetylmuramoyl-pentapeptide-transferase [Jonesia denitrificans]QXB42281.1 phospho-N-acetylmuramoyl-pentapeptide-transferase [Jonesia denitrificans]SQH20716.1 Phospho-N-acetylmuramoyl-pentapeptide-transferase [Jonesia denitrificans]